MNQSIRFWIIRIALRFLFSAQMYWIMNRANPDWSVEITLHDFIELPKVSVILQQKDQQETGSKVSIRRRGGGSYTDRKRLALNQ